MSKIKFTIKWTLKDGMKHETNFTTFMHYQDAENFKSQLWDILHDASANPDSIEYEILSE